MNDRIVKIVVFCVLILFIFFGSNAHRRAFDSRIGEDYASLQKVLEEKGVSPNDIGVFKGSYFSLVRNVQSYVEGLDQKQNVILGVFLIWILFPTRCKKE
jgi:hypothetical protein